MKVATRDNATGFVSPFETTSYLTKCSPQRAKGKKSKLLMNEKEPAAESKEIHFRSSSSRWRSFGKPVDYARSTSQVTSVLRGSSSKSHKSSIVFSRAPLKCREMNSLESHFQFNDCNLSLFLVLIKSQRFGSPSHPLDLLTSTSVWEIRN